MRNRLSLAFWAGCEQKHPGVTVWQQATHQAQARLKVQCVTPVEVTLGCLSGDDWSLGSMSLGQWVTVPAGKFQMTLSVLCSP